MSVSHEFRGGGAFEKGKRGPKEPKVTLFTIGTNFLACRLNMTKENSKKISFLKISVFDEFRGVGF